MEKKVLVLSCFKDKDIMDRLKGFGFIPNFDESYYFVSDEKSGLFVFPDKTYECSGDTRHLLQVIYEIENIGFKSR